MQDTVMGRIRLRTAARGCVAALTAAALATGTAACGSDEGGDAGTGQAKSKGPTPKPLTGNDEQQVRQLVKNVQIYFIKGDGENYCESLTAAGRKMVGEVGRPYRMGNTCEEFISRTAELTRKAKVKQKPTKLLAVQVRGDKAIAIVSDGGRKAQPVDLVKINGEWKIPDPGIRDPLGGTKPAKPSSANATVQ